MIARLAAWLRRQVHRLMRVLAAWDDPDKAPLFTSPLYLPRQWVTA